MDYWLRNTHSFLFSFFFFFLNLDSHHARLNKFLQDPPHRNQSSYLCLSVWLKVLDNKFYFLTAGSLVYLLVALLVFQLIVYNTIYNTISCSFGSEAMENFVRCKFVLQSWFTFLRQIWRSGRELLWLSM